MKKYLHHRVSSTVSWSFFWIDANGIFNYLRNTFTILVLWKFPRQLSIQFIEVVTASYTHTHQHTPIFPIMCMYMWSDSLKSVSPLFSDSSIPIVRVWLRLEPCSIAVKSPALLHSREVGQVTIIGVGNRPALPLPTLAQQWYELYR
jgi:hypothetical protein